MFAHSGRKDHHHDPTGIGNEQDDCNLREKQCLVLLRKHRRCIFGYFWRSVEAVVTIVRAKDGSGSVVAGAADHQTYTLDLGRGHLD